MSYRAHRQTWLGYICWYGKHGLTIHHILHHYLDILPLCTNNIAVGIISCTHEWWHVLLLCHLPKTSITGISKDFNPQNNFNISQDQWVNMPSRMTQLHVKSIRIYYGVSFETWLWYISRSFPIVDTFYLSNSWIYFKEYNLLATAFHKWCGVTCDI